MSIPFYKFIKRIIMSEIQKIQFSNVAKESAKFFEVYIRIKIFGHVIFEKTIPANEND